jgi:3-hydroxybutyryl-CoA dehydrogenase
VVPKTIYIIGSGNMGKSIALFLRRFSDTIILISAREFMENVDTNPPMGFHPWLIIECAEEDIQVKVGIIRKISEIYPEAIIATGTSSLSVNELANSCQNPDRFCGVHFMNPPSSIDYIELISSNITSSLTISKVEEWLKGIGRRFVLLPDSPGFLLNALLFPLINRAIYMLQDSHLTADQIDSSLKEVCGHKMGPLKTADLIGLDVVSSILTQLYIDAPERNLCPAPLLAEKLNRGELGKKSKVGFYKYE